MSAQHPASIHIDAVSIKFGEAYAVQDANLHIKAGEFFTLLGPSGCGKTTLLRTIAGFNRQSSGSIRIGDVTVDDLPAHKRDTGMVFQNYAIFPHLNVWENVAFGLKERGVRGAELEQRVGEALSLVDLVGYEQRMPRQLSGGQQQRVVIARAVVFRPKVLLMDEPLANLDAKLRVRLRRDLKKLQQKLGLTTIYVTHDQEEALSLSDRIAVMGAGKILQVGDPSDIYDRPAVRRVAEFIGEGTFLPGQQAADGKVTLECGHTLAVPAAAPRPGGRVWIGFRPQDVRLAPSGETTNQFTGTIQETTYLGASVRLEIDCGFRKPIAAQFDHKDANLNTTVNTSLGFHIPAEAILVFPGNDDQAEL